jgi:uncharacterized membrane protein
MRRALAAVGILLALGACAKPKSLLPLAMSGDDPTWTGLVRHCALDLNVEGQVARQPAANVMSVGKSTLLVNTPLEDGRVVSLWVQRADCQASGRLHPYSVSLCLDVKPGGRCEMQVKGCARTAKAGELRRVAKEASLPPTISARPSPDSHPYSCRRDYDPKNPPKGAPNEQPTD